VKLYVAAVEAVSKKEKQDETQFTTKIAGKTSFGPNYFALQIIHSQFKCLMPYYVKTSGSRPLIACETLWITLLLGGNFSSFKELNTNVDNKKIVGFYSN
jgi:hypothetical protein